MRCQSLASRRFCPGGERNANIITGVPSIPADKAAARNVRTIRIILLTPLHLQIGLWRPVFRPATATRPQESKEEDGSSSRFLDLFRAARSAMAAALRRRGAHCRLAGRRNVFGAGALQNFLGALHFVRRTAVHRQKNAALLDAPFV